MQGTSYCKYGFDVEKSTGFLASFAMQLKKECSVRSACAYFEIHKKHKTGVAKLDTNDRSKIPITLIQDIYESWIGSVTHGMSNIPADLVFLVIDPFIGEGSTVSNSTPQTFIPSI